MRKRTLKSAVANALAGSGGRKWGATDTAEVSRHFGDAAVTCDVPLCALQHRRTSQLKAHGTLK